MTGNIVTAAITDVVYLALLVLLGIPLGKYILRVMSGKKVAVVSRVFGPAERAVYRAMGVDPEAEITAKKYALSALLFSLCGLIFLFALLMLQGLLTLNPDGTPGMRWDLAFNSAASFVTNTNWQAYSGETQLSYLSQMLGMTVQNFVSAATGMAVLFALIRGITRRQCKTVGNFWTDLLRSTLYVLLPISFLIAVVLVSQGVPQTMNGSMEYLTLEGSKGTLFFGPAASQIAIKQLGTNGGGFFGVNSAHPFENPTPMSNFVKVLSILVIPAALCFTFGKAVKDSKQGTALFKAMAIIFSVCLVIVTVCEFTGGAKFAEVASTGNMEGKEVRFGIGDSSLWAVATTSASNGSVNAMHDSFTPIGGMIPMFLMQIGEVVFGGVGCGLYGMICFALLAVFICGLMVGRTPEYVGKKIDSFDMKMVCLVILPPVLCILIGTAATVLLPSVSDWLTNSGAHGFSEILYAFTSMAGNNGSAFAGYAANTPWTNLTGGIIMLVCRFVPMSAVLLLSGNLANKKTVPSSDGTLSTKNGMFVGTLIFVIIVIAALSFFPALAVGPLAEFFS